MVHSTGLTPLGYSPAGGRGILGRDSQTGVCITVTWRVDTTWIGGSSSTGFLAVSVGWRLRLCISNQFTVHVMLLVRSHLRTSVLDQVESCGTGRNWRPCMGLMCRWRDAYPEGSLFSRPGSQLTSHTWWPAALSPSHAWRFIVKRRSSHHTTSSPSSVPLLFFFFFF